MPILILIVIAAVGVLFLVAVSYIVAIFELIINRLGLDYILSFLGDSYILLAAWLAVYIIYRATQHVTKYVSLRLASFVSLVYYLISATLALISFINFFGTAFIDDVLNSYDVPFLRATALVLFLAIANVVFFYQIVGFVFSTLSIIKPHKFKHLMLETAKEGVNS